MNGWIIGYLVGAAVVAVVVVLLVLLIAGARRTAGKVEAIVAALHEARDGTAALWQVGTTAATAERIVAAAADARAGLTPDGRP